MARSDQQDGFDGEAGSIRGYGWFEKYGRKTRRERFLEEMNTPAMVRTTAMRFWAETLISQRPV